MQRQPVESALQDVPERAALSRTRELLRSGLQPFCVRIPAEFRVVQSGRSTFDARGRFFRQTSELARTSRTRSALRAVMRSWPEPADGSFAAKYTEKISALKATPDCLRACRPRSVCRRDFGNS